MISSTSQLDIHNVTALFNQLVDIHTANIFSISQQSLNTTIMKDFAPPNDKDNVFVEDLAFSAPNDKDSVFDQDFDFLPLNDKNSDNNSSDSDALDISNSDPDPTQSNFSSQFDALAISMFNNLTKLPSFNLSNNSNSDIKNPAAAVPQVSESVSHNELNLQRDLQLARDSRQLLQLQGKDTREQITFERPDGKGNYKFLVEKSTDTLTLTAKDRPLNPLLVESDGKIIESHVSDQDTLNISKALKSLLSQSKEQQNTK
jgi:hypothetical protein